MTTTRDGPVLARATDPALPGLASVPGDGVRVLAHKPGRRMTLAVPDGDRTRVLKLFSVAEFGPALAVTRLAARHGGLAPALLAVDEGGRLLELEHVDGDDLGSVAGSRRRTALGRLATALAGVHATPSPQLPAWDPGHGTRKLRRALDAAVDAPVSTSSAAGCSGPLPADVLRAVRRAAAVLAVRAGRPHRPVAVHGDTSLRNVLVRPDGVVRLLDWDRSALGPAEADLAPLVGLLGADADPVLDAYRAAGGAVDAEVLADLVAANRLTRALRRFAAGRDDAATVSAALRRSVEDVLDAGA